MINEKEKNYISAVVYLHNQEKIIVPFLTRLAKQLDNHFTHYEIIIVDDASDDHSVNKVKEIVNSFNTTAITIVHMGHFHGVEISMRSGVDLSIGDFVYEFDKITMDYEDSLIYQIYQESLKGNDIVAASNIRSQTSSKLFYKIFNRFGNYSYKLKSESFRIISRRGINRVKSMNTTIPYRKALYASCGLHATTIYYNGDIASINDVHESKMRKTLAIDSILLFTNFGYKVSVAMAALMMMITVFVGIYTLYFFFNGQSVQGWASTMLFLSFAFFGLFVILTILIKYVSLVLNLVFKKQEYVIAGIEKVTNYND